MNFRFLYDPQRQLFTIGYRLADHEGPGRRDPVVLRPAGVRSAAGQLSRDRQGRRLRIPLVPSGTGRDQRPRRAGAAVVERHDVRVPDAAARHAKLSGHAARRVVPDGRAPPDGVRRRPRRALGHLGVGLQRRRSARHVSVQGVRRPRARSEARAGRRAGGGALRLGARRDDRCAAERGQPAAADRRGPRGRLRILRRHRLHAARGRPRPTTSAGRARRRRRHRRPHLLRAPRGHDAGRAGERAARRRDGEALSRRPARAGHRAAAAGARAAPHRRRFSRGRSTRCASRRRRRRRRCGGTARRTRRSARAVPVERQLRDDRHQRRRRQQLLPRPRGDEVAARPDARSRQPVRLPARRAERVGVVGDLSPDRGRTRTTTASSSAPRARPSAATTTKSRPSSTSRSRSKTTSRSAG